MGTKCDWVGRVQICTVAEWQCTYLIDWVKKVLKRKSPKQNEKNPKTGFAKKDHRKTKKVQKSVSNA